jgi:hypothetical protein
VNDGAENFIRRFCFLPEMAYLTPAAWMACSNPRNDGGSIPWIQQIPQGRKQWRIA